MGLTLNNNLTQHLRKMPCTKDDCRIIGNQWERHTEGSIWYDWFGEENDEGTVLERYRVMFVMNMPPLSHVSGPEQSGDSSNVSGTKLGQG